MSFITPANHPDWVATLPDWVATLKATPDTIAQAANKAFELIHMRQYRAVTIHLKTDTKERSIDIAKTQRNIISPADDFELINGEIISTDDYETRLTLNDVANMYGPDFATMVRFCKNLGPASMVIRSVDNNNNTPHLDRHYCITDMLENAQNVNPNAKAPEFNITATMAIHGYGSSLIDIRPGELSRTTEDQQEIWVWEPKHPLKNRTWYTTPNTITLMRSEQWDENRLPCPHKAADRKDDGNPDTRIVGVSFISSLD